MTPASSLLAYQRVVIPTVCTGDPPYLSNSHLDTKCFPGEMFTTGRAVLSPPDCVFTVNLQVCLIISGPANLLQSHFACFERRSLMGLRYSGVGSGQRQDQVETVRPDRCWVMPIPRPAVPTIPTTSTTELLTTPHTSLVLTLSPP